jgi:hypothetical protein
MYDIISENLSMEKLCAGWVPGLLIHDQKLTQ